ncbi:hypothetical protein [Gordonia aurantiaca]|uniref:hypothetical protein n=1 Tax=Gordonia sp. B21 TaxID=3151852 RepID=UPI003264B33A
MNRIGLTVARFIVGLVVITGTAIASTTVAAPAQAAAHGWVTACFKHTNGHVWTGAQYAMTYHTSIPHFSQPQYSSNGCTRWRVPGNVRTAVNASWEPGNGHRAWYGQTAPTYVPAGRHYHLGWTYVYPKY